MNKVADILFYLAFVIMMISGAYCFIYEYLIWDKSIVSDFVDNLFCIPGMISLAYVGIYYYLTHKSS